MVGDEAERRPIRLECLGVTIGEQVAVTESDPSVGETRGVLDGALEIDDALGHLPRGNEGEPSTVMEGAEIEALVRIERGLRRLALLEVRQCAGVRRDRLLVALGAPKDISLSSQKQAVAGLEDPDVDGFDGGIDPAFDLEGECKRRPGVGHRAVGIAKRGGRDDVALRAGERDAGRGVPQVDEERGGERDHDHEEREHHQQDDAVRAKTPLDVLGERLFVLQRLYGDEVVHERIALFDLGPKRIDACFEGVCHVFPSAGPWSVYEARRDGYDATIQFPSEVDMRALVTGGAGYIGSHSVRELLDSGWDVTVLDTIERGHREAVDVRARFVIGDVGDGDACADALTDVDAVLHCAGYIDVAESVREPEMYFEVNLTKPRVLLQEMVDRGVRALVFSSTAAVYGTPDEVPIPEDAPTRPINPYGESKLALEEVIRDHVDSGDFEAITFRYFNVAGASPDGTIGESHPIETHIIPRVLEGIAAGEESFPIFGDDYPTPDGTCIRDYIHVVDLARAHRIALERLLAGGTAGTYNLGNGRGYSNLEVLAACADVTGTAAAPRFEGRREGDPAILIADPSRARDELGWEQTRPRIETMVADAWAWARTRRY